MSGSGLSASPHDFIPVPERSPTTTPVEPAPGTPPDPIRVAAVGLAMAVGLMVVALAADQARRGADGAYLLLWAGVLAIFLPAAVHAWRVRSRAETVVVLALLGLSIYLVKVIHSPLFFTFHDEFSTLRTAGDIDLLGDPFHANPLIPVHPFYPGLELTTDAVASIAGLSTFVSGLLVIGLVRILLMVGIFLLFERVAPLPVASFAAVLYAANPNFVFFDSQWAYESFALPLALITLVVIARAPPSQTPGSRATRVLAALLLAVVIVSHPVTSYALLAFLLVWAAIQTWTARRAGGQKRLDIWALWAAGIGILALWGALIAPITGGYLGPVFGKAGAALLDLVAGESGVKRVFSAAGVPRTPVAERALAFAAVLLALAAIPIGIWQLRRRLTPLRTVLVLAAILYPATLALRLTQAGTEISDRASEFVFVGVAFIAGVAAVALRRVSAGARPNLVRPLGIAVLAAAAIMFTGGIVIGWARYARLPGPYLVVADPRSVEREGRSAAQWARGRVPERSRVLTDRANSLLMGSIGRLDPQGGTIDGFYVPDIITSPAIDPPLREALIKDDLSWLVVDRRLADGLPAVGVYFERDEPLAYRHENPPPEDALLKFDGICPVGRAFDSGRILIYDTRKVGAAECRLGREIGK